MQESYKDELDKIVNRDKRKVVFAVFLGILLALSFVGYGLFFYSGDINIVHGRAEGLSSVRGKSSIVHFSAVLDNGKRVLVQSSKDGSIINDKRIIIEEVTNLFGFKLYYFKDYVKEKEGVIKKVAF